VLVPNFIGGAYTPRSTNIANDQLINLYPETTRVAGAAKAGSLIGTPGLLKDNGLSVAALTSGCDGMFTLPQTRSINPELFAALDGSLYINGALIGAIGGSPGGGLVSFATNGAAGDQLAICSVGKLFIYTISTGMLSGSISLPLTNGANRVGFLDGYFLLLEAGTGTIWYSAINDGTSWNALDFFTRSHTPDLVVDFVMVDSRIWTFGTTNIELFYDSGDPDNPFTPYPGSVMPYGLLCLGAIAVLQNSIVWLATQSSGALCIMAAQLGAAPRVISTPAIDRVLAASALSFFSAVDTMAYRMEGHSFVLFTLPEGDTWGVDLEEPGTPWHQRASTTGLTRWRARSCAYVDSIGGLSRNKIYVGDYANGNVYQLDLGTYTDNGTAILRRRRAPYLSATNQWLFIDALELGLESGVGNVASPAPQVTLQLSRDSGHTFDDPVTTPMGAAAEYNAVASWLLLGRARADRLVIDISHSEPVKTVWTPGLWLRASAGSGEL
jgi:hypothetical protein